MSEGTATSAESTAAEAETATTEQSEATDTGADKDWRAEAEKQKAINRKVEQHAKDNFAKAKAYDDLVASQATEQEKAVTEAKAAGRIEALKEAGSKLVAAELKAAAAGCIDPAKLGVLLASLDVASFLTEDGDVDAAKVKAFADALPEPSTTPTWPTLGQGQQGAAPTATDPVTRAVNEKLGIK